MRGQGLLDEMEIIRLEATDGSDGFLGGAIDLVGVDADREVWPEALADGGAGTGVNIAGSSDLETHTPYPMLGDIMLGFVGGGIGVQETHRPVEGDSVARFAAQ